MPDAPDPEAREALHECGEDCLFDCPECDHEVDHGWTFHAPTCGFVASVRVATAPALSPAGPEEPREGLREALYECFDDEAFMARYLNARSLADAVMADERVRAALSAADDIDANDTDAQEGAWNDGYERGKRAATPAPDSGSVDRDAT